MAVVFQDRFHCTSFSVLLCVESIQLVLYINLQLSDHLYMHGLLSVGPLPFYRYGLCYRGLHYLSI